MFVSGERFRQALERNIELAKRVGAEQARAEASESQLVWLRAHVDTLTAALIPKSVDGGSGAPLAERKHDAVLELVSVRAGNNSARRTHLLNWVKEERAKGRKDDDIKHTLISWPEYDPGEGDE